MKLLKKQVLLGIVLLFGVGTIIFNSCVHAPHVLPVSVPPNNNGNNGNNGNPGNTADTGICFERDILPIFVSIHNDINNAA